MTEKDAIETTSNDPAEIPLKSPVIDIQMAENGVIETTSSELAEIRLKSPASANEEYDYYASTDEKQCRFCFGDEELDRKSGLPSNWMCPCQCKGSIKWVHERCFKQWLNMAPFAQQSACNTCGFSYRKSWRLKSFSEWSRPSLNLHVWDVIEITLDMYSTFKLIRGFWQMFQGKKSIFGQICYFIFWKTFICTDRRTVYYKSFASALATSFFEPQVSDAVDIKQQQK